MASSVTRHPALGIGLAGTAQPQNNFVSEVFFTTKKLTLVTGLKMLEAVKSIVSVCSRSLPSVIPSLMLPFSVIKIALCKDDPNGNVPLGKSCNRYWSCQGGYPRLQRCPAMLVFDKNRKRCVSPPTEDCDVPATTPAPEDEAGSGQGGGEASGPPRSRGNPSQIPENRRRFQTQEGSGGFPGQGGPPLNLENLPFNLPSGAKPLSRPPN